MAKNQMALVMKMAKPMIDNAVINIYGGMALALDEVGVPAEQIEKLFAMTNEYWNLSIRDGWNMVDVCKEQTGIDIRIKVEERKSE